MLFEMVLKGKTMTQKWRQVAWASMIVMCSALILTVGCGDPEDDGALGDGGVSASASTDTNVGGGGTDGMDTGPAEVFASCNNVVSDGFVRLTDAVNYTFSSTIQVQSTTVRDATDITFQWGSLTKDFFGRPLNPLTDIDMVLVTLWNMTPDLLKENIRMDNLPLSVNKGAIAAFPEDAFVQQNLMSFVSPDGSILPPADIWRYVDTSQPDYQFPQDQYTFMLIAAQGKIPGKESRMLHFFHVDPNAQETTVTMTDNSTVLSYSTNLVTTMPVPVPAGMPNLVIDWEYMTTNALGNDFIPTKITEVMVGHYLNITRRQLDDQFIDLRTLASQTWSAEVEAGFNVDLSTLADENGAMTFPGVDNTGVWIAAMICKSCNNPAPWAIAVLQSCQ